MRLRCVSEQLTAAQRVALGSYYREGQQFPVLMGELYTPLGLSFWNGVAWVDLAENDRTVSPVPLFLFEVLEGTIPTEWELKLGEDGSVTIWPQLFYERAFHDRLSNGEPSLVERFRQLRNTV
jgi:hypothetical protein